MGIIDWAVTFRLPEHYLIVRDDTVQRVVLSKNRVTLCSVHPLQGAARQPAAPLAAEIGKSEVGLLFGAGYWIFNLLEFERLPFSQRERETMVTWKLSRHFPEDLQPYHHRFIPLGKGRVLSMLLARQQLQQWEAYVQECGGRVIFAGSTTGEIMHFAPNRSGIDLVLEVERAAVQLAVRRGRTPLYLRRFFGRDTTELAAELQRTIQFVRQNVAQPQRCVFINGASEEVHERLRALVAAEEIPLVEEGQRMAAVPGAPCRS